MTSGQTGPYADVLENRRKLEQWRAQKKAEKEEQDRTQKRAALEAHLAERARSFIDHVGEQPPTSVLEDWTRQYLDDQERARQAEHASKIAASEEEHYSW